MEYYIYVRGKKIPVNSSVYKGYWKLVNHEKYLKRREIKFSVRPFSDFESNEFNLEEVIPDMSIDVEKIVETKLMLEMILENLNYLNSFELDIIEDIYFREKTLREIAHKLETSPARISRIRDRILKKLKILFENPKK
ncbi:TPA: sigma-70 family RNA polymerase sigma factor [Streptococcus suis]|nr:sigma-70 family RNA polymerase sigma factor [Streptococcus suis]